MADDNVNSPAHYKYGKKETIEVIRDCMTSDEYHGYLKGNVLKYVSTNIFASFIDIPSSFDILNAPAPYIIPKFTTLAVLL